MKVKICILSAVALVLCCAVTVYFVSLSNTEKRDLNYWQTLHHRLLQKGETLSIDIDLYPDSPSRHKWEWAGNEERERLESVWTIAATNLQHGDVRTMKECVATVSERMKSIAPEQFCDIIRPCYSFLKGEFQGGDFVAFVCRHKRI